MSTSNKTECKKLILNQKLKKFTASDEKLNYTLSSKKCLPNTLATIDSKNDFEGFKMLIQQCLPKESLIRINEIINGTKYLSNNMFFDTNHLPQDNCNEIFYHVDLKQVQSFSCDTERKSEHFFVCQSFPYSSTNESRNFKLKVVLISIVAIAFLAWLLTDWFRAIQDRCKTVKDLEKYNEAFPTKPWIPNYPKQNSQKKVENNEKRIEAQEDESDDKSTNEIALEIVDKPSKENVTEKAEVVQET